MLVISIKKNEFQFDLNKRLNLKIKCFISNYFQHRFFKYFLKKSAKLLQLIFSKKLFIIFSIKNVNSIKINSRNSQFLNIKYIDDSSNFAESSSFYVPRRQALKTNIKPKIQKIF